MTTEEPRHASTPSLLVRRIAPLLLGVLACNRDPGAERVAVRNPMAESRGPSRAVDPAKLDGSPVWELSESLRVGDAGPGGVLFSRVRSIAVQQNGAFIVLDDRERSVLSFDSAGRVIRRIGSVGDGPGEFRSPNAMTLSGDTVFVATGNRLIAWSIEGHYLATSSIEALQPQEPIRPAAGLVATKAGLMMFRVVPGELPGRRYASEEMITDSVQFLVRDTRSGLFDRTVTLPFQTRFLLGGGRSVSRPFAATPRFAIGEAGTIYYTRGEEYRIERRDRGGRLEFALSAGVPAIPISELALEEGRRDWVRRNPRAGRVKPSGFPPPAASRAILGRLVAAGDGALLVERLDRGPLIRDPAYPRNTSNDGLGPSSWDVLDASGAPVARLETPDGFAPLAFKGDRIYGVHIDTLGVETVRRYDVRRPR